MEGERKMKKALIAIGIVLGLIWIVLCILYPVWMLPLSVIILMAAPWVVMFIAEWLLEDAIVADKEEAVEFWTKVCQWSPRIGKGVLVLGSIGLLVFVPFMSSKIWSMFTGYLGVISLGALLLGIFAPKGKAKSRAWVIFAISAALLLGVGTKAPTSLANLFSNIGENTGGATEGLSSGFSSGADKVIMGDMQKESQQAVTCSQVSSRLNDMLPRGTHTRNIAITNQLKNVLKAPVERGCNLLSTMDVKGVSLSRPARKLAFSISACLEELGYGTEALEWENFALLLEWRNEHRRRRSTWKELYPAASRDLRRTFNGDIKKDFKVPNLPKL